MEHLTNLFFLIYSESESSCSQESRTQEGVQEGREEGRPQEGQEGREEARQEGRQGWQGQEEVNILWKLNAMSPRGGGREDYDCSMIDLTSARLCDK